MLTTPDHDDALTSVPTFSPVGPKPSGFYADCDPATGEEGTTLRAEDFNELILNLRALLAAAAVAGTKGDPTILRTALHRLYAGGSHQVVATQTLTPDAAGLVLVDATTADVTLTLPSAASLPAGSPMFWFTRTDDSTHVVRIVPAAGDAIRRGIHLLEYDDPFPLRSDGIATWYPMSPRPLISTVRPRTIRVTPTGTAEPADPFGAGAFDSLSRALDFLAAFHLIDPVGGVITPAVTISIAAGTYVATDTTSLSHTDLGLVEIAGAGKASTTLQYNGVSGFLVWTRVRLVRDLTIAGNNAGATAVQGVIVYAGELVLQDVTVTGFKGTGIEVPAAAALTFLGTVTVSNNGGAGIQAVAARITAATLVASMNAQQGLFLTSCDIEATTIQTNGNGTASGVHLRGGGCFLRVGTLTVQNATPTAAVVVADGAIMRPISLTATNTWSAVTGGTYNVITAQNAAFILGSTSLVAGNRATTSPAVNTVGNVQAFIQAA